MEPALHAFRLIHLLGSLLTPGPEPKQSAEFEANPTDCYLDAGSHKPSLVRGRRRRCRWVVIGVVVVVVDVVVAVAVSGGCVDVVGVSVAVRWPRLRPRQTWAAPS